MTFNAATQFKTMLFIILILLLGGFSPTHAQDFSLTHAELKHLSTDSMAIVGAPSNRDPFASQSNDLPNKCIQIHQWAIGRLQMQSCYNERPSFQYPIGREGSGASLGIRASGKSVQLRLKIPF